MGFPVYAGLCNYVVKNIQETEILTSTKVLILYAISSSTYPAKHVGFTLSHLPCSTPIDLNAFGQMG